MCSPDQQHEGSEKQERPCQFLFWQASNKSAAERKSSSWHRTLAESFRLHAGHHCSQARRARYNNSMRVRTSGKDSLGPTAWAPDTWRLIEVVSETRNLQRGRGKAHALVPEGAGAFERDSFLARRPKQTKFQVQINNDKAALLSQNKVEKVHALQKCDANAMMQGKNVTCQIIIIQVTAISCYR
eukprot:scaffold147756_cov15-Tisochrysis_lutea.AAC.1